MLLSSETRVEFIGHTFKMYIGPKNITAHKKKTTMLKYGGGRVMLCKVFFPVGTRVFFKAEGIILIPVSVCIKPSGFC